MSLFSRATTAVGSLFPFRRPPPSPPDDSPEVLDGWIKIYTSDELLRRPEMLPSVEKITSNFRGTASQAFEMVSIPLSRVASLSQLLPASEYYHHSEPGGLLLHQLECMAMATDANYQVHQLVDPRLLKDSVSFEFEFYTNYCFHVRALTHDLGKLQTLFNIELLIEGADGRFTRKPYDAMDGGFALLSLFAHAAREKDQGARSVRYRYTFKRSSSIHEHESFWEIGTARVLHHLTVPIPGQHFELHLTDSEAFRTYLRPKLAEIDARSVTNYHTRADRFSSPEQVLFRQFLHYLALHPEFQSTELVRSADGQQLLFLPYSVIQAVLNELPQIPSYSSIPRHPQQCMYRLKGAGFTERLIDVPTTDTLVDKYNGRVGVFLKNSITTEMLGVEFLQSCSDNTSASIRQLKAVTLTARQTPVGPTQSASPSVTSAPTPPVVNPPRQAPADTSSTPDAPRDLTELAPSSTPSQPQVDLDLVTSALLGVSAPCNVSTPAKSKSSQTPLIDLVARHLESLPRDSLTQSPDVTFRDGALVFSKDFVEAMLSTVSTQRKLSPRQFHSFAEDSSRYCPDKWLLVDGELICSPAYSACLLKQTSGATPDPAAGQAELSFDSLYEFAGRTPAEVLSSAKNPVAQTTAEHASPNGQQPPEASGAAGPPVRDRDNELRALLDCARIIYQRTGERFLETDGQLARLDFRAVDEYTGDRQKRGRVLEMLRHKSLYIEHRKGAAVFIRPNHPEVQRCLVDLQKKR